jgi:transposase InsO family protein
VEVGRRFTGRDVVAVLKRLFLEHGEPEYIRSGNGSEFVARVVQEGLGEAGVKTLFVAPGSPWENGFSESFNRRFRDEFLDRELFSDARESAVLAEGLREDYNLERPHMSLGHLAPAEFAARSMAPDLLPRDAGEPLDSPEGWEPETILS